MTAPYSFFPDRIDVALLALLERAASAVGRLDAVIFRGFCGESWRERAMWSGYARALQLQAIEIDEIDVISWGCDVSIPGRARFDTLMDPFDGLADWSTRLRVKEERHWREDLPFSPALPPAFSDAPLLLRAISLLGQYARADGGIAPWLALPFLLHRLGLTMSPLPCLVGGDKGFRLRPHDTDAIIRRVLRDIERQASDGLRVAQSLESARRRWIQVLDDERKPGALRELAALTMHQPVFRPDPLAKQLGLSRSGAGKLLERAASMGFVQEISGRGSWRVYMVPDLARRLGLLPEARGRPAKPPPLPPHDPLGARLAEFDAEMAALAARFPHLNFGDRVENDLDEEGAWD